MNIEEILNDPKVIEKNLIEEVIITQKHTNLSMAIVTFILSLSCAILMLFFTMSEDDYINKKDIKAKLAKIIKNGADLEQVKHVYDNTAKENLFFYQLLKKEKSQKDYYRHDIGLSVILQDLLVDYYAEKDVKCDTMLYCNLVIIIDEYRKKNPFDNLEDNQRFYFENIFFKLGDGYYDIEQDVLKIAEELKYKNVLTNEYLNLSEKGFYISIVALIITIFFSIWQIIQGHYSSKKMKNLLETMKEKEFFSGTK